MAAIDFVTLVENAGYEWVPADQWNVHHGDRMRFSKAERPHWRERPPWNAQHTPRILLRPAHFQSAQLTHRGTWEDKSGNVLFRITPGGDVTAGTFEDVFRNMVQKHHRVANPAAEDRALFRNFARVETSTEAIAAFANRYGLLWHSMVGVPFAEWEYEIMTMRLLIGIWDAVIHKDTDVFADCFEKMPGGYRYCYADTLAYRRYGSKTPSIEISVSGGRGTLLQVAREFVIAAVNVRLRELEGYFELRTKQLKTKHNPTAGPVLGWQPNNLLGAMWLQFAESISGLKRYHQCEACQRYIELSPDVNRADRRYCSDACRNRALRRRQKFARDMRKSGKSLREISRATGSNIETLKQWLDQKGK
jgi:hypothetical protein